MARSSKVPIETNRETISDLVAKRAYEIYEARGREHGGELDDWFEAERQIKREMEFRERRRRSRTGTATGS